jgi:precorrin-3B synthase
MPAADGFLLRVHPRAGRLTAEQAHALADMAREFSQGVLTLTTRANIQFRGISAEDHTTILARLADIDLLAPESAPNNVIVTPFGRPGDESFELASDLAAARLPDLPSKFGFAVDTSPAPVLTADSADIRLERAADGALLLRADGAQLGLPVRAEDAVARVTSLTNWFLASGGASRMRAHLAAGHTLPPDLTGTVPSAATLPPQPPGPCPAGFMAAFAFGEVHADIIDALARLTPEIRITPWRMLFLPDICVLPTLPGIIIDPASPMPRIFACTGAPGCGEAFAATRALAASLAPHLPPGQRLHVSGCAKGCAHPGATEFSLTARPDGFALIRSGNAAAAPVSTGLDAARLRPEQVFG